jgi:ubiquinone/menaquinone biosynthesis C-methylase UbiE
MTRMSESDHDDVVRRSFARQVGVFSGEASVFALRTPAALRWLGPLEPDFALLDVACGAGHVAEGAARFVRQVVGVDLTRALLELGAARIRTAGIRNVLLQEGSGEALPFVDESFDVVCCRTALHHMQRPRAVVAEMLRCCRRGGRIALMDLIPPIPERRDAFDALHRVVDPSHTRALTPDELGALLPSHVNRSAIATAVARMPLDVMMTEQSDRAAVVAALEAELAGAAPCGFQPALENGALTIALHTAVVSGTRA